MPYITAFWQYPTDGATVPFTFTAQVELGEGWQVGDQVEIKEYVTSTVVGLSDGLTDATPGIIVEFPCDITAFSPGAVHLALMCFRGGTHTALSNPGSTDSIWVNASAVWVRFGSSEADAALWDDATKHRWSKYGNIVGGYKNMDTGVGGSGPIGYTVQVQGVAGTHYKLRLKLDGHTWFTTSESFESGGVAEQQPLDCHLPYTDGTDDWDTWLGAAGAKTLTLELIKVSDGSTVATDTAGFTMFIPAVQVNSPAPAATVADRFDVEFQLDESYYHETLACMLYAVVDGDEYNLANGLVPIGPEFDNETAVAVAADLLWAGAEVGVPTYTFPVGFAGVGPPEGVFILRARAWRGGPGIAAPTADADTLLTHAETYTIEITSPSDGASTDEGLLGVYFSLLQGWAESVVYFDSLVDGVWGQVGNQAVGLAGSAISPVQSGGYEPLRNRCQSVYVGLAATGLRVRWLEGEVELASDSITLTATGEPSPPMPPPGPDPNDPDPPTPTTPWVDLFLPPSGAIVGREFTAHLQYAGYTPGTGHLLIIAVGSSTATLYDADVTLGTSGQFILPLDLAEPAADGDYTLFVTLTNPAYSETAADSSSITLDSVGGGGGSDPPTVVITSPLTGAAVSGPVSVLVTATDDVAVYCVQLYVDGQLYQTLFLPNDGTDYEFAWDSTLAVNGAHTLAAVAWDADLQTATDSIVVNLANAQADLECIFYTKQLGRDSGGTILNPESANFRNAVIGRTQEVLILPAAADLPENPILRRNCYLGYHVPGNTLDFSQYTLITREISHLALPAGKSIRWAIKAMPQRTVASWEVACADMIRLAEGQSHDLYLLCITPHSVQKYSQTSCDVAEFVDLSSLAAAPVDMAAGGGKVYVAVADKVLTLDEDTGDLSFEVALPWPDEIDAVTALAHDGTNLYVAADLAAGGSKLWRFTFAKLEEVATHEHSITALAYLGGVLYVGNDNGDILTLGATGLTLAYATGEASVVRFGMNGATVYAGTGAAGKVFAKVAGWAPDGDFGWDTVNGLGVLNGWLHVGGLGTGGNYLWYEHAAGAWTQTLNLEEAVGVNDLLSVTNVASQTQLFAACLGDGASSWLYRVEQAPAGDFVCGVELPPLQFKVVV